MIISRYTEQTLTADQVRYLDVAQQIGDRLVEQAQWHEDDCTWEIMRSNRGVPFDTTPIVDVAKGDLYQGTSGIALFLGELYGVTGVEAYRETAEGALNFALEEDYSSEQPDFGFHAGLIGKVYVLFRLAQLWEISDSWHRIDALLCPLRGTEHTDYGLDVIAGAAGSIPALLLMAHHAPARTYLLEMAQALGDNLIEQAHRQPDGWSWGNDGGAVARHLCGYAHGAAGFAHALLELYQATRQDKYLYAAEQTFVYERRHFRPKIRNWPDFRYREANEYIYNGRIDLLRELIESEQLPPFVEHSMSAWCHGAPGIGLTRLRAYEILGDPVYRDEALLALRTTAESVSGSNLTESNFSLCHGLCGNAETLMLGSSILADPAWLEAACVVADEGYATFHLVGQPFSGGTLSQRPDPSLLVGEAGTGLFYLRLAYPEVSTPLLLRVPASHAPPAPQANSRELRQQYVDTFFARTRRVFAKWQIDFPRLPPFVSGSELTDAEQIYQQLSTTIENLESSQAAEQIADVFRLDAVCYQLTCELVDFSEEVLSEIMGLRPIEWRTACFVQAPHTQLVETQWDWVTWFDDGMEDEPHAQPTQTICYRCDNRIAVERLHLFAFLLLDMLAEPQPLASVVTRMSIYFSAETPTAQLTDKIKQQLHQLYARKLIAVV